MSIPKRAGFYCFSPPVMIATFLIEILLALATFTLYKLTKVTKLIICALVVLAVFQLSEYFVCGGLSMNAATWSRLGFITITALPPLGIHIIQTIAKRKKLMLSYAAYGMATAWVLVFGLSEAAFNGHVCAGNYVIFNLKPLIGIMYSLYYYMLLLIGIGLAWYYARRQNKPAVKNALLGMIIGYLIFLVPTALANTVSQQTIQGLPSIMCGFAVLFALILVGYILPLVGERKHKSK